MDNFKVDAVGGKRTNKIEDLYKKFLFDNQRNQVTAAAAASANAKAQLPGLLSNYSAHTTDTACSRTN